MFDSDLISSFSFISDYEFLTNVSIHTVCLIYQQVIRSGKSSTPCNLPDHTKFSVKMRSLIFIFFLEIVSGYEIFWNVPTFQCSRNYQMDFINLLKTYGIRANNGDNFQGENVTIFYEAQLGLYPRILKTGKFVNGGIPQVKC